MKNIIIGVIIGAVLASLVALVVGKQSAFLGAEGDSNFTNIVLDGDLTVGDDVTVSGGSFSLTTSNSATSTFSGGCFQTTATSTATPIRFVISSIATSSATFTGSNSIGHVMWQYGSCPI